MEQVSPAGTGRLAAFPMTGPERNSARDNQGEELAEANQIRRGKAPLPIEAGTIVDTEA